MGKEEQLKAREQELCEVMNTVRDDLMQKKQGFNGHCPNLVGQQVPLFIETCKMTYYISFLKSCRMFVVMKLACQCGADYPPDHNI